MNINSVVFVGNAGGDAELKQIGESQVATFSLFVSSGYGDKAISFPVRVSVWGKPATSVAQYVKKGTLNGIVGELVVRKYNDKNGNERLSVEVANTRVSFGPKKTAPANVEFGDEDGNFAKETSAGYDDNEDEFSN